MKRNNNRRTRQPWIIAHRGASHTRPENTKAAFDAAIHAHMDGIELDVQLTKDSVPVVYHNKTLLKILGARKRIADFTLSELKKLDLGGWFHKRYRGERIMTLGQVLETYGRRTNLFVEIKTREGKEAVQRHRELALKTVKLIRDEALEKRIRILSFDLDVLKTAAEAAPEIYYGFNLRVLPPLEFIKSVKEIVDGLCLEIELLTPAFIEACHQEGKEAITYSCNTPGEVDYAFRSGVDHMITDKPLWLSHYLARKKNAASF